MSSQPSRVKSPAAKLHPEAGLTWSDGEENVNDAPLFVPIHSEPSPL